MSSNNWVVHGDHTETGMPLFAADPHLGNAIPSNWLLYNLENMTTGMNLSGCQMAGMPMIIGGRSDNIIVGFTTSRVDTADLW